MQDYKTEYQRWLNSSAIDEKTRAELLSVKDNEKEQEDRFYTELEFGTAGLRGILGLVKSIKAASGKLAFCSLQPMAAEVFRISGFNAMLTVCGTREDALCALRG